MSKINTPIRWRVKIFCRKYMPFVAWITAIVVVAYMAQLEINPIDAVAIVNRTDASVTPMVDGTIKSINVNLFAKVEAGDTIAVLDDPIIDDQIATARAEMKHLQAQLEVGRLAIYDEIINSERILAEEQRNLADIKRTDEQDLRRFELNFEEAQLDEIDRNVQQAADKIELVQLELQVKQMEPLVGQGVRPTTFEILKSQRDAVKVKTEKNVAAIDFAVKIKGEAERRLIAARKRIAEQGDPKAYSSTNLTEAFENKKQAIEKLASGAGKGLPENDNPQLAAYYAELEVANAKVKELTDLAKRLVLVAPMSGIVSSINHRVGETILRGTTVVEINDPTPEYIIAWVDENKIEELVVGTKVELTSRRLPQTKVDSKVVQVGTRIERFPTRLRPNPNLPRFGLAIQIGPLNLGNPVDKKLYPGEVLDVRFIQ